MKNIQLFCTEKIDSLLWPKDHNNITEKWPALSIFTDFINHQPLVIESDVKALEVERLMRKAHVKLKFVVNKHNDFLGIITLEDMSEQEIIRKVANSYVRTELLVSDLMRPKDSLRAFDFKDFQQLTIRDVLETLKMNAYQHCLVIDRSNHLVRGIVSAKDIAKKLKIEITVDEPTSFNYIYSHYDGVT